MPASLTEAGKCEPSDALSGMFLLCDTCHEVTLRHHDHVSRWLQGFSTWVYRGKKIAA